MSAGSYDINRTHRGREAEIERRRGKGRRTLPQVAGPPVRLNRRGVKEGKENERTSLVQKLR